MRKLRAFESISVDGYFCDAAGGMSWAHAGREDAEFADWVGRNASGGGELLFGRKTYQMMEAFWPTPMAAGQMPVVAKGMNAARKYVASMTIQPSWNNTLGSGRTVFTKGRQLHLLEQLAFRCGNVVVTYAT